MVAFFQVTQTAKTLLQILLFGDITSTQRTSSLCSKRKQEETHTNTNTYIKLTQSHTHTHTHTHTTHTQHTHTHTHTHTLSLSLYLLLCLSSFSSCLLDFALYTPLQLCQRRLVYAGKKTTQAQLYKLFFLPEKSDLCQEHYQKDTFQKILLTCFRRRQQQMKIRQATELETSQDDVA